MYSAKKFHTRTQVDDNRCIIYLSGELDLEMARHFRRAVEPWVERADMALVLNLAELQYIDSTGIGFMISILKARDEIQAALSVEAIPPKIKRLFDMTGITPFLNASSDPAAERKEA